MTSIGIVGAGAGAAAATYRLDDLLPEATVTVLEKSRGVCGRAATRRRGGVRYDYGANYLKSDDDRVTELVTEQLDDEGLVDKMGYDEIDGVPVYSLVDVVRVDRDE